MRHILISGLIVFAAATSALASDRYPSTKNYVNQTGQVIAVGQLAEIAAYAPVVRALPAIQMVPIAKTPSQIRTLPRSMIGNSTARNAGLALDNKVSTAWPSGRKCCRPGQPYFNEEPNS